MNYINNYLPELDIEQGDVQIFIPSPVSNMPYDAEFEFRNSDEISFYISPTTTEETLEDDVFKLLPPSPIKIKNDKFKKNNFLGDGKFEYCDKRTRDMLQNAFQAITLTETWEFVENPIESFMWSQDSRINIISRKMSELGYDGHSGFSFSWTMRQMQSLARNGEKEFKKSYLKNNKSESEIRHPQTNNSRQEIPVGTTATFGNMTLVYAGHIP
jgi:hypothetical protein